VRLCMLLKIRFILIAFSLHPFIPEGEIQSIVKSVLRMVEAMMSRSNHPFAQPVFMEAFRVNFHIGVVNSARQRHKG